jgi:hypothetical protein
MTTQYTFGDWTRAEVLYFLGLVGVDDPKIAALAATSWGGNALKYLRVNATENGWEFAAAASLVTASDVANTPAGNIAATNVQAALNELDSEKIATSAIGSTVQAYDLDLATIAGLTATTDNFIVSVASAWASRTPAQVRTTLGLVIGTNVQAYDADLDALAALSGTNTIYYRSAANTWTGVTIGGNLSFSGGTLNGQAGTVTSVTGTSNEISVATGTSTPVISLPSALTFTGKTVTGGAFSNMASLAVGLVTPTAPAQVAANLTANPTTSVYGQIEATGSSSTSKRMALFYNTTNNWGGLQALTQGSSFDPLMLNPSGGNVGVGTGTTSPTAKLHVSGAVRVGSFTVATVPSASTNGDGSMIYVSNEAGGAVLAFSDATNWRRVTDRAVIS